MNSDSESQEIERCLKQLENQYGVEVWSAKTPYGAQAFGLQPITFLAFMVGGIAGGLLSAIGTDLWNKIKELCASFFSQYVTKAEKYFCDPINPKILYIFKEEETTVSFSYTAGPWDKMPDVPELKIITISDAEKEQLLLGLPIGAIQIIKDELKMKKAQSISVKWDLGNKIWVAYLGDKQSPPQDMHKVIENLDDFLGKKK